MPRIHSTLAASVSLALALAISATFPPAATPNAASPSPRRAQVSAPGGWRVQHGRAEARRKGAAVAAAAKAKAASAVSPPVVVAVIDGGVDITHPDLRGHLWVNAGEPAANGVDDDHDAIVDDLNGANFLTGTGDVHDDSGHGTHVSGIILQAAPNARIMALKAGNGESIDLNAAAAAVYYAVAHGARIINMSWAFLASDAALARAIGYATAHDVLVVTAAGNFGFDSDATAVYPASYRQPGLLSVAATCDGQTPAGFSNFGKRSVDLAAPGCNVSSALPQGAYGVLSGTSMAAAAVSGTAAVLLERRPKATATDLERSILGGALPESGLAASVSSGATLSTTGALAALASPDLTAPAAFTELAPAASFTTERDPSYYYQSVAFAWTPSSDAALAGYRILVDGSPVAAAAASATSVTVKVPPGAHSWAVVAYDRSGNQTAAANP